MKIYFLFFVFTILSTNFNIFANNLQFYEGTIDQEYHIYCVLQFHKTVTQQQISGSYFYTKYQKEIILVGTVQDNQIQLTEFTEDIKTGTFIGTIKEKGVITGFWTATNGKKLPFLLRPSKQQKYFEFLEKKDGHAIQLKSLRNLALSSCY